MLMADTVMDADEPRFQIGEDEMDDRQIVLGNLWVAALGNGKVFIPALAEAGISTPIVSDGQRPRSNGALHEPTKRVGAPIGYYGEPDTPGIASVLSLVLRGSRFPMTNLDGTSDENLVVDTPAFAASPSTNPCLVYLNMFPRLAADTILIGPHHASAELVENAEGRLIARQAKLSLKLNRRDAGRLAGDQISRPKPCAQRHMAAFHDGANRQARIVAALATAQDTGTSGDAEGIACGMAMRTDEAVAPSSFFHVGSTLRFIGKKLLKLWKRPRKGQVVTLKDVHGSLSIIHTKSIPSGCVRQADRQGTLQREVPLLEFSFLAANVGTRPATDALLTIEARGRFWIRPPPPEDDDEEQDGKEHDLESAKPDVLPRPPVAPCGQWQRWVGGHPTDAGRALQALARSLQGIPGLTDRRRGILDYPLLHTPIVRHPSHDSNAFYYKPNRPTAPGSSFSLECDQWRHDEAEEPFDGEIQVPTDQDEVKGALLCRIQAANLSNSAPKLVPVRIDIAHISAFDSARAMLDSLLTTPKFRIRPQPPDDGEAGNSST